MDAHLHLRKGQILKEVAPYSAGVFGAGVIMPNTDPAILDAKSMLSYEKVVERATRGSGFKPLMTIEIREGTTPSMVRIAHEWGAIAGKIYLPDVTHNSEGGVANIMSLFAIFEEMQKLDMVLCLHSEVSGKSVYGLERKTLFLPTLVKITDWFPNLRVVLEHITTKDAVDTVAGLSNRVAATITLHHLYLTNNDVADGKIQPHNFCMPIPKHFRDREALQRASISGNPKFFFGSDSAPHTTATKECALGCAGVYSAPVAIPGVATQFENLVVSDDIRRGVEDFAGNFARKFYNLPEETRRITLRRVPWTVPQIFNSRFIPFLAGKELPWQVVA
jgi:dihydroorotase